MTSEGATYEPVKIMKRNEATCYMKGRKYSALLRACRTLFPFL